MKAIVLTLFLCFGIQADATESCPQPPVELPNHISCYEVQCIHGSYCSEEPNSILLSDLNSQSPRVTDEESDSIEDLKIIQACDDDKVKINSILGEQIDDFVFLRDDMKKLGSGQLDVIRGLREMGYWWADGDHTDRVSLIECVVVD